MGLSHIMTGVTVFLTGLLPASCHKTASGTSGNTNTTTVAVASVNSTNAPTGPLHDLGALTFTNHTETCVQLGFGKDCTFTPHVIDKSTVELTLELESKSGGVIHDVSVTRVTAKTGQPVQVSVGDYKLTLTPSIASE